MYFKLTILYSVQIAIARANLGRTKIINKIVIKLHIKKKAKEKKYNNTERKTPNINSSARVLLLEKKKRLKLQLEVYIRRIRLTS